LVGNRTSRRDLINKYVEACPMPIIEVLPIIEDIRVSRVKGKTLFEMVGFEPSLNYVCQYYLDIADQILSQPEGIVPKEIPDRELFSLLSDLYLNPIGGGGQKKKIRKIYLGLQGFRINNLSTIRCKFDSFFLLFFLFIISFPYLSSSIYSSPSYYVGQN
jgi:hypothetical protein